MSMGRSWKRTGKRGTSLQQQKQQRQFALHSELDQEPLFPALTTFVCCLLNMGQPALESHLHSARSFGEPKVSRCCTSENIADLSHE